MTACPGFRPRGWDESTQSFLGESLPPIPAIWEELTPPFTPAQAGPRTASLAAPVGAGTACDSSQAVRSSSRSLGGTIGGLSSFC